MPISGSFEVPTVGRLHEDDSNGATSVDNSGPFARVYFIAESDLGGATGPCFSVEGPTIAGNPVRISCFPVSSHAPTATNTVLTIADDAGASWTAAISSSGNAAVTHSIPALYGKCTFSFNTFGAGGKRYRVNVVIQNENAPA